MGNTVEPPALEVTNPNSSAITAVDYASQEVLRRKLKSFFMLIYSLAFVLGVTGNGLVIFITGFRMKRTANTIWFLNLAIADFTFTLFLPLGITYVSQNFQWPFGEAMCKLYSTVGFINLYASIYLLTVISMDRCVSVWCPVWAQNHRTPRLASFVALGVWILALVLDAPCIHFRQSAWNVDLINCYTADSQPEMARFAHRVAVISRFTFAFVIPFTVIIVCYVAIVLRLKRDRLAPSSKPFKVITTVIVAFFVCWLPFHIFSFLKTRTHDDPALRLPVLIGLPLASSLAFFNSCLNPILYVFVGHDFKRSLRRSFLLVFQNAFAEEVCHSTSQTRSKSSIELTPIACEFC